MQTLRLPTLLGLPLDLHNIRFGLRKGNDLLHVEDYPTLEPMGTESDAADIEVASNSAQIEIFRFMIISRGAGLDAIRDRNFAL